MYKKEKKREIMDDLKLTPKEAGYIRPPKNRALWTKEGTGINCADCMFFGEEGPKCMVVNVKPHKQACCNVWTEKNTVIKDVEDLGFNYASGEEVNDKLGKLFEKMSI